MRQVEFRISKMQLQGSRIGNGAAWIEERPSKFAATRGNRTFYWHIANRIYEIRSIFGALKRTLGVL
jgi:hypothetical protein